MTAYCTPDDLKWELGSYELSDDGSDDTKFELAISAASRQIDAYCGQRFWQDTEVVTRTFAPTDAYELLFDDGISTTTGLIVAVDNDDDGIYETTLSGADYVLHPTNALVQSPALPYTKIRLTGVSSYLFRSSYYGRDLVQITAKWGWPAVPDEVKKATMIQAVDLFKAKDVAFGVAGVNDFGPLRVTSGLNAMAEALLWQHRRMTGFA